MKSCQDFEIGIQMGARGALPNGEAERLRQHLASCESCRDFEKTTRTLEDEMKATANTMVAETNWEALRARVERSVRGERGRPGPLLALALVCAIAGPLIGVAGSTGAGAIALAITIATLVVVTGLLVFWRLRVRSRLAELERLGQADLLAACGEELDAEVRRVRVFSPIGVAFSLCILGLGLGHALAGVELVLGITLTLAGAFVLASSLWARFVQLPRLVEERRELR